MRLKRSRLADVFIFHAEEQRDSEGGTYLGYSPPFSLQAEHWAGGGQVQQATYGVHLPEIRNVRMDGTFKEICRNRSILFEIEGHEISVNDGISFSASEKPTYKIAAIYPYRWLQLECVPL